MIFSHNRKEVKTLQNLDNIMDELIKSYSEDQIRNAYGNAVKRSVDNKRQKEIDTARANMLQGIRKYLLVTCGKVDESIIKECEKVVLEAEGREPVSDKKVKSDDEKLREFIVDLFKF